MSNSQYLTVGSKSFSPLSKEDWLSIGRGLGVAMIGAGLTYLAEAIPHIDFGEWTPVVVIFCSVAVNVARKWLSDTRERKLMTTK